MQYKYTFGDYTFKHDYSYALFTDEAPEEEKKYISYHSHITYELLYLVEGETQLRLENKIYDIHAKSLIVIKPGEQHQMLYSGTTNCEKYVINFNPLKIPALLTDALKKCDTVYDLNDSEIPGFFAALDTHCHKMQGSILKELLKSVLNEILIYLCFQDVPVQDGEILDPNLSDIINYIEDHLVSINTLEDIAEGLHMSSSSIYKIFSTNMNVPIMTYVRTKKCTMANSLIIDGLSPTLVCEKCGFTEYSTFYRLYKKIYAQSPSAAYRERYPLDSFY